MAALPLRVSKRYGVRCVSLPVRAHPVTNRIQEEICRLKSLSSSPNSVKIGDCLSSLGELYKCIGDLFKSPEIQQALAHHQHDGLMNELLEDSLKCIDVCGSTKDAVLQMKESILKLQSALRRKKGGDFSMESYINEYIHSRKMIKKEFSRNLALAKSAEDCFPLRTTNIDEPIRSVLKVLREATTVTGLIFNTLVAFLSTKSIKAKNKKWALVLKLVKKGSEEHTHSELESMEAELSKLLLQNTDKETEAETIQSALVRSEVVQADIQELEEGLEGLFRFMIQARVCLLNILSVSIV